MTNEATQIEVAPLAKLIAFYLPQFHPIAENNAWWGEGFTEWTNVVRARPLFNGHHQPQLPTDLGFYDLRCEDTRIAQAELARRHGIYGFCYYHYWFNGRRLLERPFNEVLKSGRPDFPFCLCWANENWTRRWDGLEQDILMAQNYSLEDDRNHIRSLFPAFEDRRYIRMHSKPIFLVYRAGLLPDPRATADLWREEAARAGVGEIFLASVESIGERISPLTSGFDAAVEFAPDWHVKGAPTNQNLFTKLVRRLGLKSFRSYNTFDYPTLIRNMLDKPSPEYRQFRCVTPSWDKTARRQKLADLWTGSSPERYESWLREVVKQTRNRLPADEQFIFVNAWNEWAEGCHLEPDQKYGRAYLEATKRAITGSAT
jgi:lipopolysaccharide biosynthesis protein